MPASKPRFRDLEPQECIDLLARHHVGRLGFARQDRVDIEPISYIHDDGWLYGRTQPGTKLEVIAHNRWIAFEVDEIEGPFDWRSVVVKGGFYILRADGSPQEVEVYLRGVGILRSFMPETLTANDPLPERAILFRIHIDEMFGREATSK